MDQEYRRSHHAVWARWSVRRRRSNQWGLLGGQEWSFRNHFTLGAAARSLMGNGSQPEVLFILCRHGRGNMAAHAVVVVAFRALAFRMTLLLAMTFAAIVGYRRLARVAASLCTQWSAGQQTEEHEGKEEIAHVSGDEKTIYFPQIKRVSPDTKNALREKPGAHTMLGKHFPGKSAHRAAAAVHQENTA